jgi:hypothetical protein
LQQLECRAKLAAEKGLETGEQAIKQIIEAEQMRKTNRKIATAMGKQSLLSTDTAP